MKQLSVTLFILASAASLHAQEDLPGKEVHHYVLPAFVEGTVKQKSGETNKALLNYNSVTEEMIFDQGGRQLALDKIENVDTVFIQDRKFVPFGSVFYEVATAGPVPLYIQHKTQLIPPGNNTGFGTSQTAAITNISDLKAAGLAYKLKLPDDYKVINKTIYWLRKNNNYYIIKTEKNIEDLFPEKADAIKKNVKDNKVNFKNSQDLIKVIRFCNE
jgi:hypothetical protein